MTYKELAIEVLKNADKPLTVQEIWNEAVKLGLDKKLVSVGKTPEATISAQIYMDIKNNGDNSLFIQPAKGLFDLRSRNKNNGGNNSAVLPKTSSKPFDEKDMYK
ncbi:MAG: winged helix-turn-helix domain-containing protein, partial [Armatimonadetes bacterium]|nr:winged helix-turn-helix domain-containing protein [Candidatus Hippobium faecium]